ncbi:MAG TPA: DUF1501 domain-containing protein [Pirellulaceae bacterium]|nr:DUF1501 domain-containing protein [Pirellulaceae bacterium]
MLSLFDPRPARDCAGWRRREFLRVGALGFAGLALPELLAAKALAGSTAGGSYIRDKAVVFLFLQGGPSHIEFFDPKMSAPSDIHSITGEVQTRTPGITFGGTFTRLAAMTDRFSIVRSYGSQNSGHEYLDVMSARNPTKATLGAIYARVAGTNHPATGMPRNVLVLPEAVQDGLTLKRNFETGALPTLTAPGDLGPNCEAFNPSGGGSLRADMEIKLPAQRLGDRRSLLAELDSVRRRLDQSEALGGVDKYQQQAFDVIVGGVSKAFNLADEDPRTIEKYDTRGLFDMHDVNRWYDMARSTNLLGRQMLLARRLVEHGCGFVTVSDCGWDMHANGNSPKRMANMTPLTRQVDHAVAAFLEDLDERGLSDKVLLVVTGEMGRTPKLNKNGGRDHYGELTPLLIAGGGLKMGQVIGQSDRQASRPATEPYHPRHLLGTLMHVLFDVGKMRLDSGVPRAINQFAEQSPPIGPLVD